MDYNAMTRGWEDFESGDFAEVRKTITDADVVVWCGLTGDWNSLYLDREYGRKTQFGDVLVPGIFIEGLISSAVTRVCFGHVYMSQDVRFMKPVYVGDTLTARAEILQKVDERHAVRLKTTVINQKGETVVEGEGMEYILKQ